MRGSSVTCWPRVTRERGIHDRRLRRRFGQAGSGAGELCSCLRGSDRGRSCLSWWTQSAGTGTDCRRCSSGPARLSAVAASSARLAWSPDTSRPMANKAGDEQHRAADRRPRVTARSALIDRSSRSRRRRSGAGLPEDGWSRAGWNIAAAQGRDQTLHRTLPLPSMPSTAKITQVLPTFGSRPHAVACFGEATTCSWWTSPL